MAAQLPTGSQRRIRLSGYLAESQVSDAGTAGGIHVAKRWREHDDRDAAHELVTSHLRLVAKIAMGYRGYGLPISEVVSEGNVGLMQAVKRFEPEKGFRSPPTPCGGSRRRYKSTSCVRGRS